MSSDAYPINNGTAIKIFSHAPHRIVIIPHGLEALSMIDIVSCHLKKSKISWPVYKVALV